MFVFKVTACNLIGLLRLLSTGSVCPESAPGRINGGDTGKIPRNPLEPEIAGEFRFYRGFFSGLLKLWQT